jgi:squalene-hopene/tetraprenyl-beta-curcumene cyclase
VKANIISAGIILIIPWLCATPVISGPALQYSAKGIAVPAASADEPKMKSFSQESIRAAAKYLDQGAVAWTRSKSCVACHTTGVYMAERPSLTKWLGSPNDEVLDDFVQGVPTGQQKSKGNRSIWRALGLAEWDRHVTGTLSEHTSRALSDMLSHQLRDGSWGIGGHTEIPYQTTRFEITVQAARAASAAPGWLDELEDDDLRKRVELMKAFLREHKSRNDYQRALKLKLAGLIPGLVKQGEIDQATTMLRGKQQADGGWSTRSMSEVTNWRDRVEERVVTLLQSEPDADNPGSDAYMTAFAIVFLREAGVPSSDSQIQRAIAWLQSNQRESGRWWMKSLYKGNYNFTSYIATAQAMRALATCGELEAQ